MAARIRRNGVLAQLGRGDRSCDGAPDRRGWITRLPGVVGAICAGVARLWEESGRPSRLHVLGIGTAGDEVCLSLLRWAGRTGVDIAITRLERDAWAGGRAGHRLAGDPRVRGMRGDPQNLPPASADVVAAALVLHRLPAIQVPWTLLHWRQTARIGVVAVEPVCAPAVWAGRARGGRASDVAELRSYPGLEGLQYRRNPWFCCEITLGGGPPPCGT